MASLKKAAGHKTCWKEKNLLYNLKGTTESMMQMSMTHAKADQEDMTHAKAGQEDMTQAKAGQEDRLTVP